MDDVDRMYRHLVRTIRATSPQLLTQPFQVGDVDGLPGQRRLPDDQRLVVMRRFVDQKSIREIAQELGRSEGAIKQLQYRALESLRARAGGTHE